MIDQQAVGPPAGGGGTERPADYFHLRTQWLQYRSQLFDTGTGLPTLAAVFDDIRRVIEERRSILLLYIDLGRENRLEEIAGWQSYDSLLKEFTESVRKARDSVLPHDTILTLMNVRGDEFLAFVPPAGVWERGGAPLVEIEKIAAQFTTMLSKEASRMSSEGAGRQIHIATGYAFIHADPMQRIERQIYRAIGEARHQFARKVEKEESLMKQALKKIISERNVRTLYQPIVDLDARKILGYEALTRGPVNGHFKDSETLFSFADKTELAPELDRLCRDSAVRTAQWNGDMRLFLNTSAKSFTDPSFLDEGFLKLVEEHGIQTSNIVFEITERVKIEAWESFRRVLSNLREHRFAIAIDDMGAGYSSLQSIAELDPEFLKFDMSLVHDIDTSLIKQDLLRVMLTISEKLGAPIIAEGVETAQEYEVLKRLGVKLAQGNFFAEPGIVGAPIREF